MMNKISNVQRQAEVVLSSQQDSVSGPDSNRLYTLSPSNAPGLDMAVIQAPPNLDREGGPAQPQKGIFRAACESDWRLPLNSPALVSGI